MKCSELKNELALYSDALESGLASEVKSHLAVCPLCRQKLAEYREMRAYMSRLPRPTVSPALSSRLKEMAAEAAEPQMFSFPVFENNPWRVSFIPLSAGVAATLIFAAGLFNFILSGAAATSNSERTLARSYNSPSTVAIDTRASASPSSSDIVSPSEYARSRMSVAGESPSINPQGTLATLARTFAHGRSKTEELVVVANVFGNGLAEITTVVEPSEDSRLIAELRQALDSGRGEPPFVPASLDGRSETVQVVLKFRNVTVNTRRR